MGYLVVCNGALWDTINPLKRTFFLGVNKKLTKNFSNSGKLKLTIVRFIFPVG